MFNHIYPVEISGSQRLRDERAPEIGTGTEDDVPLPPHFDED